MLAYAARRLLVALLVVVAALVIAANAVADLLHPVIDRLVRTP